jgi:hypothetical protein
MLNRFDNRYYRHVLCGRGQLPQKGSRLVQWAAAGTCRLDNCQHRYQ